MHVRPSLVAALVCAAIGCSSEPQTCRLDTSEIEMWATISDVEGEVEVEVEFTVADGETTLELCPDRDRLLVNGTEFEPIRVFGEQYYRVEFAEADSRYEITLERKEADSVTVAVDMPPDFDIIAPEPESTHSRSDNLDVAWSPSWPGNLMAVAMLESIGSSCIEGIGVIEAVDDVGAYQLPGGSLTSGPDGDACDVALVLTREVAVEHPTEAFAGGMITADRNRGMILHTTP